MSRLLIAALALAAAPVLADASPISGVRQLTFEGARAGEGYYSADGMQMIFQSEREPGNPFYQMYLMDLETGDVTRLSPGIGKTTCGWLHPSGETVLFASTQFDPEAEAKMQAELDFRASGQQRRYSWDYDPTYEIVEQDLATGEYRRLTDAVGYDAEGAYSPDGSRIVFASNRAAYARDLTEEEQATLDRDPAFFMDVYVMDADGSNVTRLTDTPGYDGGTFWSADGEYITWRRFSENGAQAEIYTMRADGTEERRLTDLGVMSWAPYFHPSGDYLIFATNLQGFANFELYIVDAEGEREPVRVSDRDGFDGLPTFTPDGATLSWTSNATANKKSQIFVADWDHEAALAMLSDAPKRAVPAPEIAPASAEATPLTGGGTAPEITEADLRARVAALTAPEMEGRLTGTEGERRATLHVAESYALLGLEPAGDDSDYFQEFSFTAGVALGEGNALGVSVDGEMIALSVGEDWTPLTFSRLGTVEETPVVFAGFGLAVPADGDHDPIDSYADLDVTDKWVLLWRGLPGDMTAEDRTRLTRFAAMRYKASVAKARGAAGVILMPPPHTGLTDYLPRLSFEATSGVAGMPVVAVSREQGLRMLSILGDDLEEMTAKLQVGETAGRDLIGVSVSAEVALDFEQRTGRNVLGRLDLDGLPQDEGLPPLVIGAHVDHLGRGETSGSLATNDEEGQVHVGADDNASGVAAILEVAEALAGLYANGRLDGARDIVFGAWSGEELGLLGASHFVDVTAEAAGAEDLSEAVSAYINLDMVGRMRERVVASGLGSSPIWAREIERRNAVIGLPIVTSDDTYLPTDSTSFYLAKVPILSLFTGAHEDYHTPRDTADKLNYEGLADIARFTALVARGRVLDDVEPEYIAVARPEGNGGRRMGNVFLGTIPDYAQDGVAGVLLSGVVKDGPAETAGLKGGDIVTSLAGEDLDNIYDLVRTLNGLKPGEEVAIAVERDGETVELRITPGLRN